MSPAYKLPLALMFPLAVMCVVEFIPPSVACPPIDNVEVELPLMFPLAVK